MGLNFHAKTQQTIESLTQEYGLQLATPRAGYEPRDWRMLYPERGGLKGLPHYGTLIIRATDGIHALAELFWGIPGQRPLVQISLGNFTGKIRSQSYTPAKPTTAKPRGRPKKADADLKKPRRKTKRTQASVETATLELMSAMIAELTK
tara:strand:+ start:16495 stop:16941 length:447 start_codon:yes stop_codon:yes gene_type:complete